MMSGFSWSRRRTLAVVTIVVAAVVTSLPSGYDLFVGQYFPPLPSSFIAADVASREVGLTQLNLPEAGQLAPRARPTNEPFYASGLASRGAVSLDDLVSDAIGRAGQSRQPDALDQLAELQRLDLDGFSNGFGGGAGGFSVRNVSGLGGGGFGSSGGGGGSSQGSSGGGGGSLGASGGGSQSPESEAFESVYGGPRLPDGVDIPLPGGGGGPVIDFRPTTSGDSVQVELVLRTPSQTSEVPFSSASITDPTPPPDLIFDPEPNDPESPAPVPEPATMVLTGVGLGAIALRNRLRKRS